MRDHRKLRAYVLADAIALRIYAITRNFPKEEMYGLTSQMRRAAVSVPSNIVEGCARSTQSEYVRFLEIAFGSLRELHYQLSPSHRLDMVLEVDFHDLSGMCSECEKVLTGLMRSMRP